MHHSIFSRIDRLTLAVCVLIVFAASAASLRDCGLFGLPAAELEAVESTLPANENAALLLVRQLQPHAVPFETTDDTYPVDARLMEALDTLRQSPAATVLS